MDTKQLLFFLAIFLRCSFGQKPSPCPRLFKYETKQEGIWYGTLTIESDFELSGVWIRIVFDQPVLQLGNWFGQVERKNETDLLIKKPDFKLIPKKEQPVKFFVRYDIDEPTPSLISFRINGKTVCPEGEVETTVIPLSNQLFTSNPLEEDTTISITTTSSPKKPEITCGTTMEENQVNRGQTVGRLEVPWHSFIYYNKEIAIAYLCSSSLISNQYILSSAHCVIKPPSQLPINKERLVVYLGKHYVHHRSEGMLTGYVSNIVQHPSYRTGNYEHDLALLKLSSPVKFNEFVRPICLNREQITPTTIGTVVGWGFDEHGVPQRELMKANLTVLSPDRCKDYIGFYESYFKNQSTFCAIYTHDVDNCVGDTGTAFAYRIDKSWQLGGVVTVSVALHSKKKCDSDRYVVFTDTSKYLDWIEMYVK